MKQLIAKSLLILGIVLFILSLTSSGLLSTYISGAIVALTELSSQQPLLLGLCFVALYVLITTIGLPGGAIMAMIAGYVFGFPMGFFLVILSIFMVLCSTWFLIKVSGVSDDAISFSFYQRLRAVISENPYQILLFIRFIPIAPFYLLNLLSATSGISFKVYSITGVVGLIPSSIALTLIGRGIGESLLQRGFDASTVIMQPIVLYPSLILALMSLMALIYRWTLRS